MHRILSTIFSAGFLALPAFAQNLPTIELSGELEVLGNGSFRIMDSDVTLQSTQVDLAALAAAGDHLDFVGTPATYDPGTASIPPSFGMPVDVSSASLSPTRFRLTGDSNIGGQLGLRLDDDVAVAYYAFVAFASDFRPLITTPEHVVPAGVRGTLFLDFDLLAPLSGGLLNSQWVMTINIPNNSGLVGMNLWFQSALLYDVNGAIELFYRNPAKLTVEAN